MKNAREVIIAAIKRGKTNDEALAAALKKFPRSSTTLATVNWLRNQIRRGSPKILSDRATRRNRTPGRK